MARSRILPTRSPGYPALVLVLCAWAWAQNSLPAFDAASVKPSAADALGSQYNFAPGAGVVIRNGDVKDIIQMAFDIQEFQVVDAPHWTTTARYDIVAKSANPDTSASPVELRREARLKLQTLLADRFNFAFHRETRQLPGFQLNLGKGGPKLTASRAESPNGGISGNCGHFTATNASIQSLVYMLARELHRPVEDRTGLSGRYDFKLDYATIDSCQTVAETAELPSIFASIQEQIGLKLEAAKGPVETVVVDRIQPPTAN